MRNDQRRAVSREPQKLLLQCAFGAGIERRRGFVEDQHGWFFEQRARDCQSLTFATRKHHAVFANFGIEAARTCLLDEFNEVFSTEKVNYHHLSVLIDTMTYSGRIVPVNRFGMKKNETGVLAKSSFEETSKTMFDAAVVAEYDTMRGVSANIMFGQKPPCGTGFVDILVDETRLPEGADEIVESDALEQANKAVASVTDSECRIEDILMAW